ncbi:MAG: hypothetical protein K2X47_03095 [Bdellovibrionales bacterium]|nr:hypothetical protein [Bdellovibrionales bacterium]
MSNLWIATSFFLVLELAVAGPGSRFNVPPSGNAVRGVIRATERPGVFTIDGREFRFGEGKIVGGTRFDLKSQKAMIGQNMTALLKETPTGLVLTAAIQSGLFSASPSPLNATEKTHLKAHIKLNGGKSGLSGRPFDPKFQSYLNYRATLSEAREVKVGDSALIITFSGSQGDDFGASMGHFAFGQARVLENGELSGEISNFYPTVNEKDIQPGHINLVDYFGNIVSGQNQYRPVFSLVIYGISAEALKEAAQNMDRVFTFLFDRPEFQISINNYCTTESCTTLKAAGIDPITSPEGLKYSLLNSLRSTFKTFTQKPGMFGKLMYFLFEDPAHFLPRRSFDRALQNVISKGELGEQPISRIDYIFQGQVPSERARGGLSPQNLIEYADVLAHFAPQKVMALCSGIAGGKSKAQDAPKEAAERSERRM